MPTEIEGLKKAAAIAQSWVDKKRTDAENRMAQAIVGDIDFQVGLLEKNVPPKVKDLLPALDGWSYEGIAQIAYGAYVKSLQPELRWMYATEAQWSVLAANVKAAWIAAVTEVIRLENSGDSLDEKKG